MESVFYKYGHKKRIPVSYLFLELFAKSIENFGHAADDDAAQLVQPVLTSLGYNPPFKEETIIDILTDIDSLRKSHGEREKSKKGGKGGKRTFGSEFIGWFSRLDIEQTILLLADFDFDKAFKIYSEVPATIVDKMIETKMGYEWTWAESNFEAVVYGMGGSFKGGGSKPDQSFEAPKNETDKVERDAALKKMGFM